MDHLIQTKQGAVSKDRLPLHTADRKRIITRNIIVFEPFSVPFFLNGALFKRGAQAFDWCIAKLIALLTRSGLCEFYVIFKLPLKNVGNNGLFFDRREVSVV